MIKGQVSVPNDEKPFDNDPLQPNISSSYVLIVFFEDTKALQEFLFITDENDYFSSYWSGSLPQPHQKMIPIMKIDGANHSILSKQLEVASQSLNFAFHITLALRNTLETKFYHQLRLKNTV